jgi:hypothetical protein
MAVSLVKRPTVSLVKSTGRHAARSLRPSVVVCPAEPGRNNPVVFRNSEMVASAWAARGNGPRHLCSAFDLATAISESRCSTMGSDCDCTVRLSSGSWVNGMAEFVA